MKTLYLTFWLFSFFVLEASAVVSGDDFSYDEAAFKMEMKALTELEQELTVLFLSGGDLPTCYVSATQLGNFDVSQSGFDIDRYGFNWGFCCWPIGFFVVALNPNRFREEKQAYIIGMSANIAIMVVSIILFSEWTDGIEILNWM